MSERPSLVIFDLDHTLSRGDTFLQFLIGFLLRHPVRILRCFGLPFAVVKFYLRLVDNRELKESFLFAVLGDATKLVVEPWTKQFIQYLVSRGLNKKGLEVLQHHREAGDVLVLMTASPDCYVLELGRVLGFGEVICTATDWVDGRMSGRLASANVRGLEKLRWLDILRCRFQDHFITAYADDCSDLPLLEAVDRGILVNGSRRARVLASERGLCCRSWSGA